MKLKELEKRLKSEPGNLGLRVQVAGVLRETGRSIEAVEHYRFVATAYRDQGRTQQAIAVCRSILEIAPEDAACQGLLAMLQGRTTPAPSKPVPIADDAAERSQKTPSVPPIASRPATNSSGPVSVPSVPSLRPPTPRPTEPPPLEARSRVATVHPISRPTPDERPLARTTDPIRRSSIDETPLPKPMPYHLADRTSQPAKISSGDLDLPLVEGAETRPGHEDRRSEPTTTTGLAQAARRISGLLDSKGVPHLEMDLSAELDTRQRARIAPEQLEKIDLLPATPPLDAPVNSFIDRLELDDLTTPPPGDDAQTEQVRQLTPIPRGSEDALTPPPIAPARRGTPSVPPPSMTPTARSAPIGRIAPVAIGRTPLAAAPVGRTPASDSSAPAAGRTLPASGSSTAHAPAVGRTPPSPSASPTPASAVGRTPPAASASSSPAPSAVGRTPPSAVGRTPPAASSAVGRTPPSVSANVLRPASPSPRLRPVTADTRPVVPAPAKRPTPSVPSLANRATPAMPIETVKRPTPSVPPLTRTAPSVPVGSPPPAKRPTPSVPRPTPTSLPPPPSGGTSSRPSFVAIIPPKGASSRSSITIETRGPTSNPPTELDEELTQPRDRQSYDDDD